MLEEDKQTLLQNYIMVDPDPLGRSKEISDFERDIILKFLKTITFDQAMGFLTESLKNEVRKNLVDVPPEGDFYPFDKYEVKLEVLNSNFFYESVQVIVGTAERSFAYVLKISLDPENKKLSRERDALNSVSHLFSPYLVAYENNEDIGIEFLLTTWESGENFEYYGISDLEYNFGTFASVLDGIHESDTTHINSFLNNFSENESIIKVFEEEDEREVLLFEKLTDFKQEDIENIFLKIRQDFLPEYKEDIPVLCHSNLQKSNILYQSELIKIINFENSHVSDIYYSLLKVVNNLSLYTNKTSIKNFLTKYHKHSNLVKDLTLSDFLSKYEDKRKLNKVLLFQDLFSKTLFHFSAYSPYNKVDKLQHAMDLYLNLKPTIQEVFPEYIKSFDKLFFTALPTVKTYDQEELQIISEVYQ